MTEKSYWYITTPIYYVNGRPHLGSGLTTTCCDFLARWHRLRGEKSWLLTGTDEQATKVVEAAQKAGVPTQEFVDGLAADFRATWDRLHIGYDDFIRTTEPRHVTVVQEVFRRLQASGDVYKGLYEGWYCVADETFFRDSDVGPERLCPNAECRKPLQRVSEENYFFRLSAYGDRLLSHIASQRLQGQEFLQPEFRRNEVVAFIQQGLRDMSITRSNTGWGIEVPGEPDKVIYVWFDALINYLAATGWPDDSYREKWPADVHLMGQEIFVRFHATLWPAMLMALGLEMPRSVYAHGWWVDAEGKKQGKRTGGLPHPVEFAAEIAELSGADPELAIDALRYLLLREMQFHGDTEFTRLGFLKRYNTDLANDLGNLTNRTVNMVHKYLGGVAPEVTPGSDVVALANEVVAEYEAALSSFRFNTALDAVWRLVARMNRYIEERKPWAQAKAGETDALSVTLGTCLAAIDFVARLAWPAMPVATTAVRRQIGLDEPVEQAGLTGWAEARTRALPEPAPLFPRIQNLPKEEETVSETQTATPETAAAVEEPSYISYDDFMKVELRTGTVKAAEAIPNATKLLKLSVEIGEETRTILAGIAEMYQPDELIGRNVVVVANLAPRKIRGLESQGMLLAADVDGQAILVQPETEVPSGARVR